MKPTVDWEFVCSIAPKRLANTRYVSSQRFSHLQARELFNWCQDDLRDHLVIVDGYYAIYLWYGKDTQEDEKKRTLELIQVSNYKFLYLHL